MARLAAADGIWAAIETAAPSLALHATKLPVQTAEDIEPTIVAFAREPNGCLYVVPGGATNQNRELIARLAMQHHLPSMYPFRVYVESGGLASYRPDVLNLPRRAASYVDRILKGEKAGELPVQLPTDFQFVVNLKTAKAMGLDVPASVLALVDEVIE